MNVTLSKSGAVKINEVVVGIVLPIPGQGFCYQHYKFGLRPSSCLPTKEELMVRVEEYLQKSFA